MVVGSGGSNSVDDIVANGPQGVLKRYFDKSPNVVVSAVVVVMVVMVVVVVVLVVVAMKMAVGVVKVVLMSDD